MHPYISILDVKINVFSLILIGAVFSCIVLFVKSDKYNLFYFDMIKKSVFYIGICAGIFGKLIYIATRINEQNISILERLSGFVYYGGFIGAVIGMWVFCQFYKQRFLDYFDTFTSILPLGQAIGRIGCYFNGCCYGKPYDGLLAVTYFVDGKETKVFPTWFMESVFCLIVFLVFFMISKEVFSGFYASIYMITYSLFRFCIEYYRGDEIRGIWLGISTSQFLSITVFCFGIILLSISVKAKEKNKIILGRNKKYATEHFSSRL